MKGADFNPTHFDWGVAERVATVTLNRPERKNPLTMESYAELRDTFHNLRYCDDVKAVVVTGAGGNFCSGGDVHDIIGKLVEMRREGRMDDILAFTRMTGDLIKEMRQCPQPVIAAIEGVCVGAGACMAMASDLRYGTPDSKMAFLFTRVGLAGCDMGACSILPRIVGQGRASELLYTGRSIRGDEAERWGLYNAAVSSDELLDKSLTKARELAAGPSFAHSMTKRTLHQEWNMSVDDAIEAEAQAQAICMQTADFERAYQAFVEKRAPVFEGN